MEKELRSFIFILSFFAASLIGAVVFFSVLKSYAEVVSPPYRLGGAIAGFIVIFYALCKAYSSLVAKPASKLMKEAAKAITKPQGFREYRSVERGFSIYYPKKWEMSEEMSMEVMLRREDGLNVHIATQKASKKAIRALETDPSVYFVFIEKTLEMLFKGVRTLEKTTTALHGIQCPTFITEKKMGGKTLRQIQVVYLDAKGEKLHFITWTTSKAEYEDLKPLFEKILSTFQIT